MPFDHPAPRSAELCDFLRHVWSHSSGPLDFEGEYYRVKVPAYARPGQRRERIPLYLAGVNPIMVRTAAEAADGLVGHPIYTRSYLRDYIHPAVDEGLRRAGRQRSDFDLASCLIVAVSSDAAQARQEAKQQIAFYSTVRTYDLLLDSSGFSAEKEGIRRAFRTLDIPAMAAAVSDEMLAATAVAGTPDECRAQLAGFEGLLDTALLYTPTFGVDPRRVSENHRLIIETFGGQAARG
jgi:alkanesulfonate monooxygenase SsuD/methylene tetrahydromethanopterin reductase-like flavin-dependent oxidoreductase (luciferase family)